MRLKKSLLKHRFAKKFRDLSALRAGPRVVETFCAEAPVRLSRPQTATVSRALLDSLFRPRRDPCRHLSDFHSQWRHAGTSGSYIVSKTAEVDGIKLYYLTAGHGPALIFSLPRSVAAKSPL